MSQATLAKKYIQSVSPFIYSTTGIYRDHKSVMEMTKVVNGNSITMSKNMILTA